MKRKNKALDKKNRYLMSSGSKGSKHIEPEQQL